MEKPTLHIPSVLTQSCFIDPNGEVEELKATEIDYFYLLLFLYREELLQQTPNLLLKDAKKYYFNEMANYGSVDLEMIEFQNFGVVSNSQYKDIKSFINKLSELFIRTNLFRKNKDRDIETIKVVGSHSWDSTLLTINLTKEFVALIIHIEKYFMKVDLTNIFKLSGAKSKRLHLMLKDYSKSGKKDLRKNELELLIGKIPQLKVFAEIKNQINTATDINISIGIEGIKKKKYKFIVKNKVNPKSTQKQSKSTPSKQKDEIDAALMDKCKQKLEQRKNKGGEKIYNDEAYLKKIYDDKKDKLNSTIPKEVEKTEADIRLENWINEKIKKLKSEKCIKYSHNNYLFLKIGGEKKGRVEEYFIGDDYKIYNRANFERNNPITDDSVLSMKFIDYYYDVGFLEEDVFCSYGQTISNTSLTKIER
jgi:plasmid replication initiation protein